MVGEAGDQLVAKNGRRVDFASVLGPAGRRAGARLVRTALPVGIGRGPGDGTKDAGDLAGAVGDGDFADFGMLGADGDEAVEMPAGRFGNQADAQGVRQGGVSGLSVGPDCRPDDRGRQSADSCRRRDGGGVD